MERRIGTVSRGLRGPIIKEGDDLKKIVVDTLMECLEKGDFEIGRKDVQLQSLYWLVHRLTMRPRISLLKM